MYLPTADGGRAITDAVTESMHIVNMARALAGEVKLTPKNGARFHFELPGSVQGFVSEESVEASGVATAINVEGSSLNGKRSLAIKCLGLADGRVGRVQTPTFIPSIEIARYFNGRGYALLASPTIYSGQKIQARMVADKSNSGAVSVRLYIKHYNETDGLTIVKSEMKEVHPGKAIEIDWKAPDTNSFPIACIGLEIIGSGGAKSTVNLVYLTWSGAPSIELCRPGGGPQRKRGDQSGMMWKRAWISGFDGGERMTEHDYWPEPFRLIQNVGRGIVTQGTREWQDYEVTTRMTPHMCEEGGVAVRVQGLERYYALIMDEKQTRLVRRLDGKDLILAEIAGGWVFGSTYDLKVHVTGNSLTAFVNGKKVLDATDPDMLFGGGGIGLLATVGRIGVDRVSVQPLK
jgi:hypothetical protein